MAVQGFKMPAEVVRIRVGDFTREDGKQMSLPSRKEHQFVRSWCFEEAVGKWQQHKRLPPGSGGTMDIFIDSSAPRRSRDYVLIPGLSHGIWDGYVTAPVNAYLSDGTQLYLGLLRWECHYDLYVWDCVRCKNDDFLLSEEAACRGVDVDPPDHCTFSVGLKNLLHLSEKKKKMLAHVVKPAVMFADDFDDEPTYKPIADFITGFTPAKTCSQYLLDDAVEVMSGCPQLPLLVDECKKIAGSKVDAKVDALKYLAPQELFALVVWSFDLSMVDPSADYTSNFYYQCNKILQDRDQKVAKLKGYLHFIFKGLQNMPNVKVDVFRGLKARSMPTIHKFYSQGQKVHWSGFSSTTTNFNVARNFAGHGGIVIKLKIVSGKILGSASALAREEEILLMPNFAAVVISDIYRDRGSGMQCIDLAEVTKAATHVF